MVETRRNGVMLAPWTYTSDELCELEIDHVFRHQWILAGHISELAQSGDYLTFDLANERAVLVLSLIHISEPTDQRGSRMPSSA